MTACYRQQVVMLYAWSVPVTALSGDAHSFLSVLSA